MCSAGLSEMREADGRVRQVCSQCGWRYYPHMAVSVSAVLIQDGKVLLVKRSHRPCAGSWMFPSGFLEYGEHPEEGVLREFREETNLDARVSNLLGVFRSEDDFREPNHVVMFYRVSDAKGDLRNDDTENEAISWFPISQLPQIELANHQTIAQRLSALSSS